MHQAKYTKELMKKFNMVELKSVSTLMSSVARVVQMKMARLWTRESTGA
jgi:hypothetical protein